MSPSGAESFQRHADVIQARKGATGDFQQINYFAISDGQTARVRFLEQGDELTWAQTHRVRNQFGGFNDLICLDQYDNGDPCPACQSDNIDIKRRSTKGFVNLIWRGTEDEGYARAPIYKRDDKGRLEKNQLKQKVITGYEDSVWLWKCSKAVYEQILEKDVKYKGAMSRDFCIKRKGATKDNTQYFIEPAVVDGGPEPMTVADATLSQGKLDIAKFTMPEEFQILAAKISGQQSGPSNDTFPRSEPNQESVFSGGQRSSAFSK